MYIFAMNSLISISLLFNNRTLIDWIVNEDKLNLLNRKGADSLQDESTNIKKNVNKKKM